MALIFLRRFYLRDVFPVRVMQNKERLPFRQLLKIPHRNFLSAASLSVFLKTVMRLTIGQLTYTFCQGVQ